MMRLLSANYEDLSSEYPNADWYTFNGKDIYWLATNNRMIFGLDRLGKIRFILKYPPNSYSGLTSVIQHNNRLYLGSLRGNAIGWLQLPDSITNN